MPSLRVKGLDRVIEVEAGAELLAACKTNHVNVFWGSLAKVANCRGKGFCNLCVVEVLEGAEALTPKTKRETKRLRNKPDSWRLACTTKVAGDVLIDPFPVRHAQDRVSPEALHRAGLDPEELKTVEAADWEALHTERTPKQKAPKKGLLAKVRKKKGIDDSDDRDDGAPLAEAEIGTGAAPAPEKRGRFGKKDKKDKKEKPAKEKPEKPAKGKRAKAAEDDPAELPLDTAWDAETTEEDNAKRFGIGRRKK